MFNINELPLPGEIPEGRYTVLVHSVEAKDSKAGNPMDAFATEIISPEFGLKPDGKGGVKQIKTAGVKIDTWFVHQNDSWWAGRIEGLKRLGFVPKPNYGSFEEAVKHVQEFNKGLEGKMFDVTLSSKAEPAREALTAEHYAQGLKEGPVIINPTTDKPVIERMKPVLEFSRAIGNVRNKDGSRPF